MSSPVFDGSERKAKKMAAIRAAATILAAGLASFSPAAGAQGAPPEIAPTVPVVVESAPDFSTSTPPYDGNSPIYDRSLFPEGSVTLTFQEAGSIPPGTIVTDQFASFGVTFSPYGFTFGPQWGFPGIDSSDLGNFWSVPCQGPRSIHFTHPTTMAGFNIVTNGPDSAKLTARRDGVDLETQIFNTSTDRVYFVGIKNGAGFDELVLEIIPDYGSYGSNRCMLLDSLEFIANQAPVASAGGPYAGAEGAPILLSAAASSDPDGGALTYAWDLDADGAFDDATGVTASVTFPDDGSFAVAVQVTDAQGATDVASVAVTVDNVAPAIAAVSGPAAPLALTGANAAITVAFTDPAGALDTYTAFVDCGDGASWSATAVSPHTATCTYAAPGVYTVTATVSDEDGGVSASAPFKYVVVYDPAGSFVTGGGWVNYDGGACPGLCAAAAGVGKFGFVAKYLKGATVPTGNTELEFDAGTKVFASTSYDWLVATGAAARLQGTGVINGAGDYAFLLVAVDGSPDGFRIQITDRVTGEVVFDNQTGADAAGLSTTALDKASGNGSIMIH